MNLHRFILSNVFVVLGGMIFVTQADNIQTIEVVNNSAQLLNIAANNNDRSLHINQTISAFTKSLIVIQITQLKTLQDRLFEAILNNSYSEVRQAIREGADVNQEKDGKSPLLWAVLFQRTNAAKCLINHGAQ